MRNAVLTLLVATAARGHAAPTNAESAPAAAREFASPQAELDRLAAWAERENGQPVDAVLSSPRCLSKKSGEGQSNALLAGHENAW